MKTKPSRPFEISDIGVFEDVEQAKLYLEECLIDGNIQLFQEALKDIAKARAKNSSHVWDAQEDSHLSEFLRADTPSMESVFKVVQNLGMRFSIV